MNVDESKQLCKGDKIDMIVTGGSGRIYKGLIVDTDEEKLTVRWDDGEMGHIEHRHADYLRKSSNE
ncbi:MAG: hypothetical protein ABL999_11130 [Pyrinomonadaceae bacterium]